MLETDTGTLVGAVMPDRSAAAAAAVTLRRRGISRDDMLTAVVRRGRRVIDSGAGKRIGVGVIKGAAIGALGLALASAVAAAFLATRNTVWLAAAAAGAFVGAVIGAYLGLNRTRPMLWEEEDWAHVDVDGDEVLLVTRTTREDEAIAMLEGHGGRCVKPGETVGE
jgi:hypothetical protein